MHMRTTAAAALLLLGVTACDRGSTDPEPAFDVQLAAAATSQMFAGQDGSQLISCDVGLHATARGDDGMQAVWGPGVLRYFAGADRTTPVDSLTVADFELAQIFGPNAIHPGYSESNTIRLVAATPFSVQMAFTYRVNGRPRPDTATAEAVCGPVPVQGARPVVSGLSVTGPEGELQPGDTLTVTWTAQSPVGLWEMGIQVSGAFVHMSRYARYATTEPVTSTVKLVIPAGSRLGSSVQVRPFAVDAAMQSTVGPVHATAPLVDRRAPTAYKVATVPADAGVHIAGQFPAGDSLDVSIYATDNHGIEYLVYEVGAPGTHRDSLRMPAETLLTPAKLPIPGSLAGQQGLRVQLRDFAGNASPWYGSQNIRFFPTRTVPVNRVSLTQAVSDVAMDATRGRLYAAVANDVRVRVFSLPGLAEGTSVTLPRIPWYLDLTPAGDTLVAVSAWGNGLMVADVVRGGEPRLHELANVRDLYGVRVGPGGRAVTMAIMSNGGRALLEVNLATGAWRNVPGTNVVPGPEQRVSRSLDRRRMVAGGGCLYDAVAGTMGTCRTVAGTLPLVGDATGTRWARQRTVFGADLSLALRLPNVPERLGDGIALLGDDAYVTTMKYLIRARLSDGRYEEGIPLTGLGGELRFSDDGSLLASWRDYAALDGTYPLIVLDPRPR